MSTSKSQIKKLIKFIAIDRIEETLTNSEFDVFHLMYLSKDNLTLEDVATQLGVSPAVVKRVNSRVLRKINIVKNEMALPDNAIDDEIPW